MTAIIMKGEGVFEETKDFEVDTQLGRTACRIGEYLIVLGDDEADALLFYLMKRKADRQIAVKKREEAICGYSVPFGVDDIVFLVARLDAARSMLLRYGSWWRVRSGYHNGTAYLLESIFCKGKTQKRTEPKTKIDYLVVGKNGDNNYDVTNVIKFPCSLDQIP
jgi:hypothetical protein